MLNIIAILITGILEYQNLLRDFRDYIGNWLKRYVKLFTNREVNSQREIRYIYLFACLPIIGVMVLLKMLLIKAHLVYLIIQLVLFTVTVSIFGWKDEAIKGLNKPDQYIKTFATTFFSPLFWFLIFGAIGSLCYLIINLISEELKSQKLESIVYNSTVDKMLFYANIIPYVILSLFTAIAGDFEETTHFLVEQRKEFSKSFYTIENNLQQAILIAIGKHKFKRGTAYDLSEAIEAGNIDFEKFDPQINTYVTALLYRIGLFYVGAITLLGIATFFS